MLRVMVSGQEFYNEETYEFTYSDDVVLELEHSLASLSKWESRFRKPFLGQVPKTTEEVIGYIEAMDLSGNFSDEVADRLNQKNIDEINEYIGSEQTATTFSEPTRSGPRARPEIITAELIYFWMVTFNIPLECENWHLSRLFTLLRVCNIKNSKDKKMSRSEAAAQQRALNAQRRAQLGTRG